MKKIVAMSLATAAVLAGAGTSAASAVPSSALRTGKCQPSISYSFNVIKQSWTSFSRAGLSRPSVGDTTLWYRYPESRMITGTVPWGLSGDELRHYLKVANIQTPGSTGLIRVWARVEKGDDYRVTYADGDQRHDMGAVEYSYNVTRFVKDEDCHVNKETAYNYRLVMPLLKVW